MQLDMFGNLRGRRVPFELSRKILFYETRINGLFHADQTSSIRHFEVEYLSGSDDHSGLPLKEMICLAISGKAAECIIVCGTTPSSKIHEEISTKLTCTAIMVGSHLYHVLSRVNLYEILHQTTPHPEGTIHALHLVMLSALKSCIPEALRRVRHEKAPKASKSKYQSASRPDIPGCYLHP
ncbi:hypothetical protein BGZ60DRAFT_14798 [Tricladium varicosporioides]|nr:hypothetical protein BGZ60DRAFT_14798 [Hymenoscyphus varicosporioides]